MKKKLTCVLLLLAFAFNLLLAQNEADAMLAKFANAFGWTDTGVKLKRSEIQQIAENAKAGDSDAKFIRGVMLYRAYFTEEKDTVAAAALFRESAEMDNPYGMAAYGVCLLNGEGTEPDPKKASALFRKSAENGCALGIRNVGEGLLKGGRTLDMQMGAEFLKSAAELGDVYAKTILASCYDRGIGMERDALKASKLLKESADAGNAPALFALGMMAAQKKRKSGFRFFLV